MTSPTTSSPPLSPRAPDAHLAPLKALFPSTSDDILDAVLDAHGGDLQAATESLLDLNNPEFKSEPAQQEELEQIDLDAELARQLAEEDQLHYRQQQQQRRDTQPSRAQQSSVPAPVTYQAYVPKRRRATGDNPQQGHGSWAPPSESTSSGQRDQSRPHHGEDERDELDVLAENFSKLAEQGKKSFGTFFSKMKEQVGKLDEMIQQSASPSTAGDRPPQPPPKSTTSSFGSARTGAQWTAPEPLPRPADAPPRTSTRPRDTLTRQDTNDSFTIGDDTDHSPNPSPSAHQPHPPAESIDSYFKDFDSKTPPEPPIKITRNDTSPSAEATTLKSKTTDAATKVDPPAETLKNASPAPPTKDPRKDFCASSSPSLGLVSSVSLLDDDKLHRSSASGSGNERIKSPLAHPAETKKEDPVKGGNESDDSDELEYVKSPFDED
ncbi:hypothetical protein JCM11491_004922 [Sporobolomyces phaffii]